jgi:hypothetical protein
MSCERPGAANPGTDGEKRRFLEIDHALQRALVERSALQAQWDEMLQSHIIMSGRHRWALNVAAELARSRRDLLGRLAQLLPHTLWRRAQLRRLQRKGLFDSTSYSNRYPDLRNSRLDALYHFLAHGVHEGRWGGPNSSSAVAPSEQLVRQILASGLFDFEWYMREYGVTFEEPEAAVLDYWTTSHVDPLRNPGPLFSGAYYVIRNPDAADVNPLQHYLERGLQEGRRAFSPLVADLFMEGAFQEKLYGIEEFVGRDKPILLLTWSEGNFFFTDIAEALSHILQSRGFETYRTFEIQAEDFAKYQLVVIAPHEFCVHGPGATWPAERLHDVLFVNTEQWHTSWFSLSLGKIMQSRKVLDINPASARGLSRLGMKAGFVTILPLVGDAPARSHRLLLSAQARGLRHVSALTSTDAFDDRPYDVLYVAIMNDRRAQTLASLAPHLAKHRCFIHTPGLDGPMMGASANKLARHDVDLLARNTKILLNIHQGSSLYFEWHRIVLSGICQGCIVVTEPCIDIGVLKADEHFLSVHAEMMGPYLDWLLTTPAGRDKMAKVRANCADWLRSNRTVGNEDAAND